MLLLALPNCSMTAKPETSGTKLIYAVVQCVGIELLGRELDPEELACIARRVAPLLHANGQQSGNDNQREKLTPPQVAKLLGVNADKVRAWVKSGALRAANLAANTEGRARYRIDVEELRAFLLRRSLVPEEPPVRRRKKQDESVIEFF